MKRSSNYLFLAVLVGVSCNTPCASPPRRPLENLWLQKNPWVGLATALGIAGLSFGSSWLFPQASSLTLPVAALAGAGIHYGLKAHGLQRIFTDLNTKAQEDGWRGVVRDTAEDASGGVGRGLKKNLSDPLVEEIKKNIRPIALTGLAIGGGLIALWYGAKILNNYYEEHINKPRLDVVVTPAERQGLFGTLTRQIIVDDPTRERLNLFLLTNFKVKQSNMTGNEDARFRTALLWGPAGSGKRMFALEEMARFAHMDFYAVPWSSFQKFKEGEASRAIDEFFKHEVTKSPDGAIVYIDNAQMLFGPTLAAGTMPPQYAAVRNSIIENLEARSSKFIVIFGMTNKPILAQDTALIVDDVIEISSPKLAERKKILKYYRDLYFNVGSISEETRQAVERMLDDQAIENLARRLDKTSASELASFMNTLKIEASLPTSEGLTPGLVAQLVSRSEHKFEEMIMRSENHYPEATVA
jgi:hypothetical protein